MTGRAVLIDAGPLVAILSSKDQFHRVCVAESHRIRGLFYTSWPVITEAAYLLSSRPEKVAQLLHRVRIGGIRLLHLDAADVNRISEILAQYADQGFDLADASLMYLAERERMETVFTIDQRHFSVFRTVAGHSLSLRPSGL